MLTDTGPLAAQTRTPFKFDEGVERYLDYLRLVGYSPSTLRKKRKVIGAFAQWARSRNLAMGLVKDSDIGAFVSCLDCPCQYKAAFTLSALQLLFKYFLAQDLIVARATSPIKDFRSDELLRCYVQYLRTDRGLTECSVRVYTPFVRDFLAEQAVGINANAADAIDASAIRRFLVSRAQNRSSEYSRLLAIALRSLCRFLFIRGETAFDLSVCVPTVRRWRQASIPAFLAAEDVARCLATPDLSTSCGRRDHAILLLLARLGLRPGEIVVLELDDLHWRSGELTIHGKGQSVQRLPLLPDIGEALSVYLRMDRGTCASRRVFLRERAPHDGLAGPGTIGQIVRVALARAGIERTSRGAAHLLRHSLATQMIRKGASLAQIAEVLRHRSENTTAIYAKVSDEALRSVARPWPISGEPQ
jgi:site-specific recombinase XerD